MLTRQSAKQHRRNHSWPPFRLHLQHSKDIDEDPFAFFISSDNDSAGFMSDHMNADIDIVTRSRSHSPRMAHNKAKLLASGTGKSILKLKKWVEKMEVRYFHSKPPQATSPSLPSVVPDIVVPDADASKPCLKRPMPLDEPENIVEYIPVPVSPPLRGRSSRRSSRRPYGNRMVRGHSKRARAWREPGESIWSVMEEEEGLGIMIPV